MSIKCRNAFRSNFIKEYIYFQTYLLQINKMSEAKKEMPRIQDALKGELLKEHSLKKTEANEKNVLPSAEDVKQEKTHQNMLSGTVLGPPIL